MTIDKPTLEQLPALRALWQEAFGDSENFLRDFVATAYSADRCRCLTAEGTVATALYWFDCSYEEGPVAYLYAIATAKSYRGRGLCTALMKDTHRHLREQGYCGTLLVPGNRELFAFYEKMGYRISGHVDELNITASADTVEIFQIDAEEYARRRKSLLPRGGVIQERENLRFLQTQATLYAGKDFLLAARRESDSLFGLELLGNTASAPAILQTLNCPKGRFRIPGNGHPFAMFYPLGDRNSTFPTYFGLAFD